MTQDTPEVIEKVAPVEVKAEDVLYKEEKKVEPTPAEVTPEEPKKEEEKPVETPAVEEKPTEELQSEEYVLALPEGSQLTEEDAKEFQALAKEAGLSKEVAQKLFDDKAKKISNLVLKQEQEFEQKKATWKQQAEADEEIGGEKFKKSVLNANLALDKFAPQGLRKVLDSSGLGNYPDLIKMLARIGEGLSNDTMVSAPKSAAASSPKNVEDIFYPNM